MNRILLLTVSFLLMSFPVLPQNAKKGFKWLEKLEYDKAKSVFNELFAADNQNPAVNLGLAFIYSDDKSPFYDLVQGWTHCILLEQKPSKENCLSVALSPRW